jgi:hypothetical protein
MAMAVPSCSFGPTDRELFADVTQVITEGVVLPPEARTLARQIERALEVRDSRMLESLTQRLPGLLPAQVAAGANTSAQRRVLMLARTILEAVALQGTTSPAK